MTAPSTHITCDQLGTLEVVRFHNDVLVVHASTPAPPGTRVVLREREGAKELAAGKVTSLVSDRHETGRWEITIKLFAPSKAARELLKMMSGEQGTGSGE